jgi:hypothetical protein
MDYRRAIGEMYPTARFFVEETYDSLVWWEDIPKPSDEEIIAYYESSRNRMGIHGNEIKTKYASC